MNKEKILRNLEYMSGAITAIKTISGNKENNKPYSELLEEWNDIIWETINLVEEDDDPCPRQSTNWQ